MKWLKENAFQPVPGEESRWIDSTGFEVCGKAGSVLADVLYDINCVNAQDNGIKKSKVPPPGAEHPEELEDAGPKIPDPILCSHTADEETIQKWAKRHAQRGKYIALRHEETHLLITFPDDVGSEERAVILAEVGAVPLEGKA